MPSISKKADHKPAFLEITGTEKLLLKFFLDALGEHGDNLVEVAHNTQVSNAEDGGELVLVDGDDVIALLHTGEVLDGTADTASHI